MKKLFMTIALTLALMIGVSSAGAACIKWYQPNRFVKYKWIDYNCDGRWDYRSKYVYIRNNYTGQYYWSFKWQRRW